MARRGDTKPLCHGAHASVALPGVRLWPLSGDKALVLCHAGSPSTPCVCSSRPRRGSPVYLGTVIPWSTATLPSGRWVVHVARDATLRER